MGPDPKQGRAMENPFRPTFGRTPPELLDRGDTLEEFEYGLRIRSGVLGLLSIITGTRGVGKTVMLNEAQDLAQGQGWAVISETSTDGFLTRIADAALLLDEGLGDGATIQKSACPHSCRIWCYNTTSAGAPG